MQSVKLLNIGFGNVVAANRVIAIVNPESASIKRVIQTAKEKSNLIDATYGRKTRSVIITDTKTVVLSSLQPETIVNRLAKEESIQTVI